MATNLPRCLLKGARLPVNGKFNISQRHLSALSSVGRPGNNKDFGIQHINLTSNGYILPGKAPLNAWNALPLGCRFGSNRSLPTVMQFPNIIWPSVLKTIKNWIMINFIVKPYFDKEFDMSDFVGGTKHALEVTVDAGLLNFFMFMHLLFSDSFIEHVERRH